MPLFSADYKADPPPPPGLTQGFQRGGDVVSFNGYLSSFSAYFLLVISSYLALNTELVDMIADIAIHRISQLVSVLGGGREGW